MSLFADNLARLKAIQKLELISDAQVEALLSVKETHFAELEVEGAKYPAWRISFSQALGPGKGGIRFHPDVNEDEVSSLAFWMALKNSLAGLPYGGAKGGIKFDPRGKDKTFLEKMSRAYIQAFHQHLGQDKDIPAPDVYTNQQVMAWMLDEYEKIEGRHEPGMITGKPEELGGIAMRSDATAEGAYIIAKALVHDYFDGSNNLSIAIQGFGNAGGILAKKLADYGLKIVAVSDSQGGIYKETGLDLDLAAEVKNESGSLAEYPEAEAISNGQLLELPVDILVLAALENQIVESNADKVKAKAILEVANGPVSLAADDILSSKGIIVVPDILANAGGVIVSYFEWAQNRTGQIILDDYLRKLLSDKMESNWQRIRQKQQSYKNDKVSLRLAAYAIAVERILKTMAWRKGE